MMKKEVMMMMDCPCYYSAKICIKSSNIMQLSQFGPSSIDILYISGIGRNPNFREWW